jgi:hypothetical protein
MHCFWVEIEIKHAIFLKSGAKMEKNLDWLQLRMVPGALKNDIRHDSANIRP